MEVVQTYSVADAAQAEQMLKGAPEGWRQTLDKLEAEVARMQAPAASAPSSTAPSISSAPMTRRPEQVYRALSDEAAKSRWFYRARGMAADRARQWISGSAAASGSRAASTAA